MKIFIVCGSFTGGGAERVGVMLANGFARHGHDVSIVTDVYKSRTYEIDGHIRILPLTPNTNNKLWKWTDAISLLRRHIKKYHPDVSIGIELVCSFVSKVACIGYHIPTIMTEHYAFEFVESETYGILRKHPWLRCLIDRMFSHVTVLTEADRKVIGNKLKKVSVMPNPSTFPQCAGVVGKDTYMLAAGRIGDWHYKGFDILIEAWSLVAEKYPDWKILIAGDGPKENFEYLKGLAKSKNIEDRVAFLGFRKDMLSLYQKASIFILSSRSEGLPMVLIEAMSQGCAPVATGFKGRTKEIITCDDEGLTCNPEDINGLSSIMEKMISDDEYRRRVQNNAIKRSEYYNLDRVISLWEHLFSIVVPDKC